MTTHNRLQFPATHRRMSEQSFSSLCRHSGINCKRLMFKWLRDPNTTAQALFYPALTLLMLWIVLGEQITSTTRVPSIYGQTTMITLIAAMTGSTVSALGLKAEVASGLLGRLITMPVHRASALVGRLLAEGVRTLVTTLLILFVGVCLGFRFSQGVVAGIALISLPIIFGVGFAVIVTTLATAKGDAPLVEIVSLVTTLLMFFNTGFVPIVAYPIWMQTVVKYQPMSCAIDAMKGLSLGGPVAAPLMATLAWSIGMFVVFAYPAIRGYRRAAAS